MTANTKQRDGDPQENPDEKFIRFFQDKYGWTFEKTPYVDIPIPREEYIQRNKEEVDEIIKHLRSRYIITDHFGSNDKARTDYRESPPENEREFVRWVRPHSKLAVNHLMGVLFEMQSIISHLPAKYNNKKNRLEKILSDDLTAPFQLSESGGIRYKKMSIDERISYTRKIDEAIIAFLAVLS